MPPFFVPFNNKFIDNNFLSLVLPSASAGTQCTSATINNGSLFISTSSQSRIVKISSTGNITDIILPGSDPIYALSTTSSGRMLCVVSTEGLFYSDDSGETWALTPEQPTVGSTAVQIVVHEDTILLYNNAGRTLTASFDDGNSWSSSVASGLGTISVGSTANIIYWPRTGTYYRIGVTNAGVYFDYSTDAVNWTLGTNPPGPTPTEYGITANCMLIRENGDWLMAGTGDGVSGGALMLFSGIGEGENTTIPFGVNDYSVSEGRIVSMCEHKGYLYLMTTAGIWKEITPGDYNFKMVPKGTGWSIDVDSTSEIAIVFNGVLYISQSKNLFRTLDEG